MASTTRAAHSADKKDSKSMVVAVFRDRTNASQAYNWLLARGYNDSDINVMMSNETRAFYEKHQDKISAGTHGTEGVAAGGTIGAVVAVFRDRTNASQAYNWLLARGYSDADINVMMSNETRAFYEKHDSKIAVGSHATEGAAAGGTIGAVVGGAAAAIAAIGSLAAITIPGLNIVVAGPLLMGLAGAGAGAVTGGGIGALIGLGIPESNADAYEEALKQGGVVMGVEPRNDDSGEIKKEFQKLNGENIIVT